MCAANNGQEEHQLSELQVRLLSMLEWFHNYCEENKLRYYIVEGTVIGAIRHHGFIPWDDDIDVGMPRRDYNRLMALMKDRIGNYFLETPYTDNRDYFYPWCKLCDVTTTKIEKNRYNHRLGIYIDVFPIDGLGNTREESLKNYRGIDFLNMLWASRYCAFNRQRSFAKNAAIALGRLIPQWLLDNKKLVRHIDRRCQKLDFDSSEYVCCTLSTYRGKEIMEKRIYGKPSEHEFENITVYVPEQYDAYLRTIYGQWWVMPPREKQVSQHDYVYLNLNEPYKSQME